MMRTSILRVIAGIGAAICLAAVSAFAQQTPRQLYERARMLDDSNQNLTEAIRLYSQVVNLTQDQRALAASAEYRIGVLYERLGRKADAQRAFKIVVNQYSDQPDVARRAQARIARNSKDENKGPAGLRFSHPPRLSEQESSYAYQQWLNQHPEIIRDHGAPIVAKFINVHEQQFKGGTIIYNVTDEWSVILFSKGDGGGVFKKLSNPGNLTPGIGDVDEDVFAEVTNELTKQQQEFYRSLVDSRVKNPDRRSVGIIGGIASLYIMNNAYDDLGLPLENEQFLADVVYASAKGYELLAGLRHSVGELRPGQIKSVYVLYPDNTYRRHITFQSNNGGARSPGSPIVITPSLTATHPADNSVGASHKGQTVAYVPNQNSNSVSVIDTGTNAVVATIPMAPPQGVAITPSGAFAYVTNYLANTVSVIDTATNTVVAVIPVGAEPLFLAITPDGAHAYVGNAGSPSTVSVIDTATNTVVATIPVGAAPYHIVITPDGRRAYVANNVADVVSVIDTGTNTVVATISVGTGGRPSGIAITPDGARAYVTLNAAGTVAVIETGTNTLVAAIAVGNTPAAVAITPDGAHAYVTLNAAETVAVIDTTSNKVIATVPVGSSPYGVAITPDGSRAYVTRLSTQTVSVIDTATNDVMGSPITGVGSGSSDVAIGTVYGPTIRNSPPTLRRP